MTTQGTHNNKLLIAILIGAVSGVICGWIFGSSMQSLEWIGALFLDALKMTIIPLIVAAVITGVTSLGDIRKLGKVGFITVFYYACTTGLAVFTGMLLVNIIQPGAGYIADGMSLPDEIANREPTGFAEIIRSMISPNLVASAADTQLLPIIIFCLLFAAALTTVGPKNRPLIEFFDGLNEVMMKIVIWIMYFAPIGIFALIAAKLGKAGGGPAFWQEIQSVGWYIFTVLIGLLIHFFVLTGILWTFTRKAFNFLVSMSKALVTAFGTASSSATLPLTMECATEAGIDNRSIKFVLPLGATVNMDGTALYEAVAVMFIAQAYAINMDLTHQITIFITATLAAIGAAGIPQAGLVTMIIVLTAVDLPIEGISMLLAVDWFLDRFRTTVNVWGDSVGAAILDKFFK